MPSVPKFQCPSCKVTMRPDVGDPYGPGVTEHQYSRIECTHCGHKLGTANWELP